MGRLIGSCGLQVIGKYWWFTTLWFQKTCDQDRQFHPAVNWRWEAPSAIQHEWVFLQKKGTFSPLLTQITAFLHACQRRCFIYCIFILWLTNCVCVCMWAHSYVFFRDTNTCVKCLICKSNTNAPYQSALSHLEEGVEIIHESCQLSQNLSNLSVELWHKTSDLCWETHQDSAFFFFFPSWGFCFLWKPRSPWQRLPNPI